MVDFTSLVVHLNASQSSHFSLRETSFWACFRMATIQLQKTVTTTKTALDQKQSLDVVQTLLHGGLSSLAYLR